VCVCVCVSDLSLVCVLLGVSLIVLLDCCRSSSDWVLLGSGGSIWDWTSVCVVLLFTVLQGALYHLPVGQVRPETTAFLCKPVVYHSFILFYAGDRRQDGLQWKAFKIQTQR